MKVAGQIRCNRWSERMQKGGQVECNFADSPEVPPPLTFLRLNAGIHGQQELQQLVRGRGFLEAILKNDRD